MSGSNPTPHGYKAQWGYYTDVESGILFLTHRYLDPATGRFLTRDPIGVEGGVNLYAYVRNSIVLDNDPSGCTPVGNLICRRVIIIIGAGASDGPLPIGDIIACGIAIITVCEVVGEIAQDISRPIRRNPPCSVLERKGYLDSKPNAALKRCLRLGERPGRAKGPEDAKACRGGKHYSYNTSYGRFITVLCCPCEADGKITQRCRCKEH